jgi:hypothetical protein
LFGTPYCLFYLPINEKTSALNKPEKCEKNVKFFFAKNDIYVRKKAGWNSRSNFIKKNFFEGREKRGAVS